MSAGGFLLVAGHAFRRVWTGRRLLVLGLVSALPLGLGALVAGYEHAPGEENLAGLGLFFVLQIVVPFVGLLLGVGVLGDEIEGRTITYLFTRPHGRSTYLLARYCGLYFGYLPILAAMTAGIWALFSRFQVDPAHLWGLAASSAAALAAFMAVFALLGILTRRALILGFLIAFVFEGLVSKLPDANIARLSVWHHAAALYARSSGAGFPDRLLPWDPPEGAWGAAFVLAGITAAALVAGCLRLRNGEVRVPGSVA